MTAAAIAAERERVALEVRTWIGTPFHHAARIRGAGVDCAQLLIAVYAGLGLVDEPTVPFYPPNWFLHHGTELMRDIVAQFCVPVETPDVGDIALFRFGRSASHAGIIVALEPELLFVHSFVASGVKIESLEEHSAARARLDSYWTLTRWVS